MHVIEANELTVSINEILKDHNILMNIILLMNDKFIMNSSKYSQEQIQFTKIITNEIITMAEQSLSIYNLTNRII